MSPPLKHQSWSVGMMKFPLEQYNPFMFQSPPTSKSSIFMGFSIIHQPFWDAKKFMESPVTTLSSNRAALRRGPWPRTDPVHVAQGRPAAVRQGSKGSKRGTEHLRSPENHHPKSQESCEKRRNCGSSMIEMLGILSIRGDLWGVVVIYGGLSWRKTWGLTEI